MEKEWTSPSGSVVIPSEMRLYLSGGRTTMDRVSESLLNEFSAEHGIAHLKEDKRFEHFAAYVTVQRHNPATFDPGDVVTGGGNDTGIDAIAVLVNSSLVTDLDVLKEQMSRVGNLDVTFVFVTAKSGSGFDGATIGSFGFGVLDFFKEIPSLKRNASTEEAVAMMAAMYKQASKFRNGKPSCWLYYVTTGRWQGDATLEARRQQVVADLDATGLFREVQFLPIDAEGARRLYMQTKHAVRKEFRFDHKVTISDVPGVKEAYLGFLPAPEFLRLIQDETGEIINGLFHDNVRDWLDSNPVNDEIMRTLETDARSRFVLMNNGITVIARSLQPVGNNFVIEDFSIVNGCQTSHVLFRERDRIDSSVLVPIRLIGTQDEAVINDIIRATNRQTEVKPEQFFALEEFPKQLEVFFQAFEDQYKLYYERRTQQYHSFSIEKTRIVVPHNMIRAYAAMFLAEPHRCTRNYAALRAKVGTDIFAPGHCKEPYYTAAYTLYRLEYLFRSGKLAPKYKPARFHILLAARCLANPLPLPRPSSHDMERYCQVIMDMLWDSQKADDLITEAARVIERAAAQDFERDNIRTESFTHKVLAILKEGGGGGQAC